MNKVEGALIYPDFNLLVQPNATNNHWSCDHLALAESTTDSTPAINHAVIYSVNARHTVEFMDANSMIARCFNKRSEHIVLRVQSPEDINKEMDFIVDVFIIDQARENDINNPLKGCTYFDPSYVASYDVFGQQDID